MAAGGSINVEELQKRLQCAICLDTVYNPKRLVCNHSFCKECLDKALKFNEDGSAILKCPKKCEARTRITRQQTTNNLQVDYMLKDILEVTCQTSEGETKTRCNACTRDVTKYCVRCQLFLCDHCEDPHSADEESFVCVEYHRARKEVMIVCSEHSTEASYVCREGEYACDNDFVCIYCIHRDHKVHTFEPYSQVEEKLKTSMKEKIISNGDHENRKAKVLENVANVKQHFEKAVRTNKLKCINEYIEYLNKEEEKLRDEFNTKTGNYINAFDSIAYFEECLSKDGMSFMLQRNEIVRRLYDHDDGDNLTIPDIKFTLGNTNFKDEHPLGSINVVHRKHLPSNISPGVQFQSANYLWKSYIFSLKHYVGQFTEELNSGGGPSWYTKILAETEELNEIDEQNIRGEGVVNLPVHNVSKVRDVVFSESVMIMNLPWRVKFVPMRGVGCRTGKRFLKSAGIFLQCDPKDDWHSWSCQAQALITIKQNSNSTGADLTRTVSHIFSAEVTEWGYGSFIAWRDLKNFTNADTLTIEVAVQVGEPQGVFVGSRKFTGFVGLKSQGGVGYMNSFLQMLFFTNLLRKAVYNTPTDYDDDASVMLALQRVFYELQFRNTVPASVTGKLTKLLQPEGNQEFFLHNHGFGRLCRKVTPSKALLDLLCGHAQQHIECTNVEYSSTSQEPASAMQKLTVKGKSGVLESLDEFINGIMLTGDKKYDAGEHGLQEAKQTYRFTKIPPLLHLNLLRFQYDATTHSHYKINDRYTFPETLDLTKYLKEDCRSTEPEPVYTLHSVLVHSGENDSGGHDAVYINPHGDGNWFKFHDDIVYPVSKEEAVDNNFGNSQCPSAGRRANAYMLSYIRSSSLDEILCEVTQDDIPECLKVKFSEERRIEAQRKKESNEAHLYMDVQVLTEDSFSKWSGHDLFNTKNVKPVNFKIRKNETLENATKIIAESFGYEAMQCHLWPMRKRGNGTVRPFGAGIRTEAACSSKTPDELSFFSLNGEQDSVVIVFLEVCESEECELDLFPNFDKINHKMVHFKYYNPSAKILSYCGHAYVDPKSPPSALSPMLCERAGLSEATPLLFYKEVDWKLTEKMSCEERLEVMELRDGDIICFQVDESLSEFECPTPVEYLKYMSEQVDIHFYDRTHDPKDYKYENYFVDTLYLEMPFIEMVDYIAGKVLNVARNRIRFFKPQVQLKCPGEMIKSTYGGRLKDIVCAGATTLYFRLLNESDDIPEEESEFKCTFINAEFMVEYPLAFEIRKKEVTVQDIFNEAMVKIKTYFRDSEKLRLIELSSCKIQRIVAPAENLDAFIQHSQSQYRIEEIPNEEVDIDEERAMLLPAMHFQKIPSTTFGRPFYIKLHEGEAISSMKARVRHKLRLSELQFKKIKFARVCMGKVTYLRDVPSIKLVDFKNLLGQPQMLGLDYIAPRSTHTHDDNEKTLRSVPRTIKLRRQIIVQFEVGHQAVCRRHPTPFGHTHDWSVFVRGAAGSDMSHFVDKVLFTLHESFPNHHRVRRIHPYRLHETGYGSFKLGVELFFHTDKHPSRYQFDYELNLQLVGMPPYKFSRLIHLPFLAPCEDFERKLLHGGGKIVLPLS